MNEWSDWKKNQALAGKERERKATFVVCRNNARHLADASSSTPFKHCYSMLARQTVNVGLCALLSGDVCLRFQLETTRMNERSNANVASLYTYLYEIFLSSSFFLCANYVLSISNGARRCYLHGQCSYLQQYYKKMKLGRVLWWGSLRIFSRVESHSKVTAGNSNGVRLQ